jgi:hypothetical protein
MPTLLDSPDVFGHAIFCDDIRMEVDGKMTFVGVYRGRMYVHGSFPFTLPKFGIAINFAQIKEKFVANLGVRIALPGDPDDKPSVLAELNETSEGAIEQAMGKEPLPEDHHKYNQLSAAMVFSHLVIKEPGAIAVRVLRNDELHRVGRLLILQGSQGQPIPPNEP